MKWSRSQLRAAAKLQAIECARKTAAEAQLKVARSDADNASERSSDARSELDKAEQAWSDRLSSPRLNIELQLGFANELLRSEQCLAAREEEKQKAGDRLEQARQGWTQLEAGVRTGDRLLSKGRRFLARRAEEQRNSEITDQTTWKWFKR